MARNEEIMKSENGSQKGGVYYAYPHCEPSLGWGSTIAEDPVPNTIHLYSHEIGVKTACPERMHTVVRTL